MPETRTIERRIRPLELREAVPGSNGRQRWATAVTYGTVDSYGTIWTPGVFTEALAERMPTILYGHDWWNINHVLGQGIDSREMDYGVDVLIEFADPDVIEAARTAIHLVSERIIRDVSVGFTRYEWRQGKALTPDELALGATEAMDRAGMDELSLVVRGAVPGATIRSRRGAVDLDAVVEIARRKAAGELTDAEAQAAIDLLAGDGDQAPPPAAGGDDGTSAGGAGEAASDSAAGHAELDAEVDQLLAAQGWT